MNFIIIYFKAFMLEVVIIGLDDLNTFECAITSHFVMFEKTLFTQDFSQNLHNVAITF